MQIIEIILHSSAAHFSAQNTSFQYFYHPFDPSPHALQPLLSWSHRNIERFGLERTSTVML